jgi:hypothetical protein
MPPLVFQALIPLLIFINKGIRAWKTRGGMLLREPSEIRTSINPRRRFLCLIRDFGHPVARALQRRRSLCALCGKKHRHAVKKPSIYLVTLTKGTLKNKGFMTFPHNSQ